MDSTPNVLCDPPPPRPPPRGLGDLPIELKAEIVALCHEQDEEFRALWTGSEQYIGSEETLKSSRMRCGKSLSALFRLDKIFSELAAPFVFRAFPIAKIDSFNKAELPSSRLDLVRELVYAGEDHVIEDMLAFLPRLRKVEKATFELLATCALCEWVADPPVEFRSWGTDRNRLAAASLGTLRLQDVVSTSFVGDIMPLILHNASTIRSVKVHISEEEEDYHIANLLRGAPHLHTLHLGFGVTWDFFEDWEEGTAVPPLRRLFIISRAPNQCGPAFAILFASTLLHLSIDLSPLAQLRRVGSLPFIDEVFPSLRILTFIGDFRDLNVAIRSIEPRHFPRLTTVELDLAGVDEWDGPTSPLHPFLALPFFSSVAIANLSLLCPAALAAIRATCETHNIALSGARPTPCASSGLCSTRSSQEPTRPHDVESLRSTMRYLQGLLEKAEDAPERDRAAYGSVNSDFYWTEVEQLRTQLRPFEQRRRAEEIWKRV